MKRTVPRLEGEARQMARGELIGQAVTVVASTDEGLVGFSGTIVDETLRTFVVRGTNGRESRIGKAGNHFGFQGRAGMLRLDGRALEFRPAERTKKVR